LMRTKIVELRYVERRLAELRYVRVQWRSGKEVLWAWGAYFASDEGPVLFVAESPSVGLTATTYLSSARRLVSAWVNTDVYVMREMLRRGTRHFNMVVETNDEELRKMIAELYREVEVSQRAR